ncbi:hypothetical protein PYCCODRAFT_1439185 [Trametes coccinea BRFM310]|uniref:DUF4139 domain-containing protein n=1 Tax=Trametes coccinea (strain BRFM310) TaxID=1353009 RepID=A0A1Y2IBM0_TRAC3|nr:hypothetical protein PYCCODRAFT_1439185 [Trametes coccinea BRFM310]
MLANTIVLNATRAPVTAATIFQSDTAELTRFLTPELKEGRNVLKISDVSGAIHPDSPRLSGAPDGVRVVDVVCHKKAAGEDPSIEVGAIMKRGKALYAEREVRRQQVILLDDAARMKMRQISPELAGGEGILEFVERYGQRKLALQRALQNLDEEIGALERKLVARKGDASALIIATVVADRDVKVSLKLTYLVSGVTWRPFYDLHATTVDGQPCDDISMRYCATIVQCTGEDWNEATVTLSTTDAQAQRQLSVPVLRPLKMGVADGRVPANSVGALLGQSPAAPMLETSGPATAATTAPPLVQTSSAVQGSISASHVPRSPFAPLEHSDLDSRRRNPLEFVRQMSISRRMNVPSPPSPSPPPPHPPAPGPAPTPGSPVTALPLQTPVHSVSSLANTPSRSALSVAYRIDGDVTIPSDGEEHQLTVALLKFKTKLSYTCVPRQSPNVYIVSKVENISKYDLLPGTVNVYMNDSFVMKTSIKFISVNEAFDCVLGVDTSINVTYRQDEKTAHGPRHNFADPQKTTTRTMVTTIINRHNHDIPELIVRESIPLSSEEDKVNVILRKPAGLASAKDGQIILDRVETDDGQTVHAKVRWTEVLDGNGGEKDGLFEWIHAIPAGKKVSFEAQWDVKSPSEARWAEQTVYVKSS